MTYAPEHEKGLLNRSHRGRMGLRHDGQAIDAIKSGGFGPDVPLLGV